MLARRRKSADFREPRSLENFDFGFNPSINRAQIYELAACQFVRQHRDVLLVGPPGVGTMPGARLCRSVVAVWLKSKDPDVKGPAYSGGISRDR
jgi:hypothetical protein